MIAMVPLMTLIVFTQVIMRYVFNSPFTWAEEMSRMLMIWISCIGSAYALKTSQHISLNYFRLKMKGITEAIVILFSHISLMIFFTVVFVKGIILCISELNQFSPAMGIPMAIPFSAVPFSFGIALLFTLEEAISDFERIVLSK